MTRQPTQMPDADEFYAALEERMHRYPVTRRAPLETVRYDLTPGQQAEQEARIKLHSLPF